MLTLENGFQSSRFFLLCSFCLQICENCDVIHIHLMFTLKVCVSLNVTSPTTGRECILQHLSFSCIYKNRDNFDNVFVRIVKMFSFSEHHCCVNVLIKMYKNVLTKINKNYIDI